jgi:hypothetical protein
MDTAEEWISHLEDQIEELSQKEDVMTKKIKAKWCKGQQNNKIPTGCGGTHLYSQLLRKVKQEDCKSEASIGELGKTLSQNKN